VCVVAPYTLCEQEEAADFGGLEALHGFGAALELVECFDVFVGVARRGLGVVVFGGEAVAFALFAEVEGFVFDDCLSQGTRSSGLVVGALVRRISRPRW
jgi:hypothetical protein